VEDTNQWMFGSLFPDAGAGGIFKLQVDGSNFTTLHTFSSIPLDGSNSYSRLLLLGDVLFGTTQLGGVSNSGTIFRLNADGTGYQLLHHFRGTPGSDGAFPYAGLVEGPDRFLYGTTIGGGLGGRGTVYKILPDGGGYRVVRHFATGVLTNGYDIYASLVVGINGELVGTTFSGGNKNQGTIFRINTDGAGYQVLHQFGTTTDGRNSYSGLTLGTDGFLYGTTPLGGASGAGTIFKLRDDGSGYSIILNFGSSSADGLRAYQGLTFGKNNVLYGVTTAGGTNNTGTLFKIATDGSAYQTLCHFQTNDTISSDLFLSSQGQFYGSLRHNLGPEAGTLFRFVFPGLVPLGAAEDSFRLLLSGVPGVSYTVEASEDLISWRAWLVTNLDTSPLEIQDPDPRPPARFYRAR
jgi:uncharacterized repeat protein (TIGR03803 family)